MEVTDRHIARIPRGNLRVPRVEFAAVWRAAERLSRESGERRAPDWYAAAVATTCRWLAATTVRRYNGRVHVAEAPVSRREVLAYEELIEAEVVAADNLALCKPHLLASRPGWCEGIRDTLTWAWRHEGPPPLTTAAELPASPRPPAV
jgi:hypothetical protein